VQLLRLAWPGTDPHWSNVELKLHMLFPVFFPIDKTRTIRTTPYVQSYLQLLM